MFSPRESCVQFHSNKCIFHLPIPAGIMSTAYDMARRMYMLLNDRNINGTQIIDADVIAKNWSPANVNHNNDDDTDIRRPR